MGWKLGRFSCQHLLVPRHIPSPVKMSVVYCDLICGVQVPMIRTSIMKGDNWRALAEEQREQFLGVEAAALSEKRMQSMLKTLEAMCDMQPDLAADKA